MLSGWFLPKRDNWEQILAELFSPEVWRHKSRDVISLISRILRLNSEERLSVEECLFHAWTQNEETKEELRKLEGRLGIKWIDY